MLRIILLLVVSPLFYTNPLPGQTILTIGGIFPMSAEQGGWAGGQACRPAALMALNDVNNRPDILPGYYLNLSHQDSQCQPGLGAKIMYELLYKPPTKLMLLVGCSLVTTIVAEAASRYNLVTLSYGASSPALSDRERFPTLFRTHPSATIHNPTRVAMFKHFKWKKIAIILSVEEIFTSTAEDLESLSKSNGIEVVSRQNFAGDPGDAVKNLKRANARIIVGLFYEPEARKVLCEAYRANLYGKKYVWFLIGWYKDTWYTLEEPGVNCTKEQMSEAAEYHFTTEALMWNQDKTKGISGMTADDFKRKLTHLVKNLSNETSNVEGFVESPLAYDAIWALALALNCTMNGLVSQGLKLEDFKYTDDRVYQEIHSCMNNMSFAGISGRVMFSAMGDRIAWTLIEQLQHGKYERLAYFDSTNNNLSWVKRGHYGKFARNKPPADSTNTELRSEVVKGEIFWIFAAVAIMGVVVSIAGIIFNVVYRERRIIKQSQADCNNLMLVGAIVSCIGVFFHGLDSRYDIFKDKHLFAGLCQTRVWLLSMGFSLGYGSLFAKVWRVHRMSSRNVCDQEVDSWKLFATVGIFVGIDVIVLVIWFNTDPLQFSLENFEKLIDVNSDGEETEVTPYLEHCQCEYGKIWIGFLYAYKGILLLFGLFLAYEVRDVKVKHLNDARFVGMAIYNVVVLCLITGPVSLIILSQTNANFVFVAVTILLCTFISIAVIFIPKVLYVKNMPGAMESRSVNDHQYNKEDEEKYKRLLAENDSIKRKIAEKESRIRDLTAILQAKLAEKAAAKSYEPTASSLNGPNNDCHHRSVTFTEPQGELVEVHKDPEDSGYRSGKSIVEPHDSDVLL